MREVGQSLQTCQSEKISLENVHKCSTYTLRQELKKYGYYDDDYTGEINYNILLEKMVHILQKELSQKENDMAEEQLKCSMNLRDRLTKEKEKRKAELLERSRLRQSNRNYFEERRRINKQIHANTPNDPNDPNELVKHDTATTHQDVKVENTQDNFDPFAHRFKSKIGGKYI